MRLLIFVSSLLFVSILFSGQKTYAETGTEVLLSEADTKLFLKGIQGELTEYEILNLPFLEPEEQVAILFTRDAARKAVFDFLPGFIATETVKTVLKVATFAKNIPELTFGDLIGELEKRTVQEAVSRGTDWLLQNNVKVSSGTIVGSYTSYWGGSQVVEFQYLMTYAEQSETSGQLVFEFYSADLIDPPARSTLGFPWELGDWLKKNKKKLDPFVVHAEFQMKKIGLGWTVDSSATTKIAVEFPEKVPRLQLAKELPYPLEEKKREILNVLNTAQRVLKVLESFGNKAAGTIANAVDQVQKLTEKMIDLLQFTKGLGAGVTLSSLEQNQVEQIQTSLQNLSKDLPKVLVQPEPSPVENLTGLSFPQELNPASLNDLEQIRTRQGFQQMMNYLQAKETLQQVSAPGSTQGAQSKKDAKAPLLQPITWCAIDHTQGPALSSTIFYEIAWMGSTNSANDEWIKLKNISNSQVNLAGWQLQDQNNQIQVAFSKEHGISPQGIFVLERTNDDSLLGTIAHLIYTGGLSNTNEALYLFDEKCVLRDKVAANPNWPAGESDSRKPMARGSDLSWHTLGNISASPAVAGQSQGVAPAPSSQPIVTYPKILISEIQIEGQNAKDEFIELYNPNNQSVDLKAWSLKKKTSGGSDSNLVSAVGFSGTIAAFGYFLVVPPLNDDGTSNYTGSIPPDLYYSGKTYSLAPDNAVFLYNPNAQEVDRVGFGQSPYAETNPAPNPLVGQSLSRKIYNSVYQDTDDNAQDFHIQTPTPKAINSNTPAISGSPQPPPPPPPPPPAPPPSPPLPTSVVINEIAWAGTKAFSSDEWLELYNPTLSSVDLTGWKVKSSDTNGPEITLAGSIAAQNFYLIERTSESVTSQPANLFVAFGNGLSNTSCETLSLYNAQDTLMDQTACKTDGSWPAGSASPNYITLERINASNAGVVSNWASNNLLTHNGTDAGNNIINGTPKATNSVSLSQTIDPDLRFSEFATVTLTLLGSPYVANSDVTVPAGKTLAVEPGVTVKFKNNNSHFTVDGTLSALGQSAKKIVFTNDTDTGDTSPWCALKFSPTSTNSVLEHVTVDHAGTTSTSCGNVAAYAIFADGSSITFKNSSITTGNGIRKLYLKNSNSLIDGVTLSGANLNADAAAIYIEGGAPTIQNSTFSSNSIGIYNQGNPTISNNTFTNVPGSFSTYAVKLNVVSAALSGNTASSNTYNGTFLEGAVTQNTTLQADTMPYIVNSLTIDATKTLTLQAGVVIKFVNTPSTPELIVNGTVLANGTSASKVVFTALDDDTVGGNASDTVATPHWKWIRFPAGGTGNLQNTVVKFGGNTSNQGALSVESGGTLQLQTVEIRNTFFGDSFQNSGLKTDVATTGAVFGSNILFADNKYAMYIVSSACPEFTQVTITPVAGGATLHPLSFPCPF